MKKKSINIRVDTDNEDKVEVKINSIPEDVMKNIPRPGESIYIIEPYPGIDPEDVDGVEILEEDIKVKPIMGYSYAPIMVKGSVLADDLESVMVNGDYKIPLYKNSNNASSKIIALTNEEEALNKYRALMTISIKEATRREKLQKELKEYLEEALEKVHH